MNIDKARECLESIVAHAENLDESFPVVRCCDLAKTALEALNEPDPRCQAMYNAIEDVVKVGYPHNFQIEPYVPYTFILLRAHESDPEVHGCDAKVAPCDFEPKAEPKK